MLYKPEHVYYDTGERTYSGTGRNRQTTLQVALKNTYDVLPVSLQGLTPRGGTEITQYASIGPLAAYWAQFGQDSAYEVYFEVTTGVTPILGTKGREKSCWGGWSDFKEGGALVLLPPIYWDEEALRYKQGHLQVWKKDGIAFGKRVLNALVEAAEALRRAGERSPAPEWAKAPQYETQLEMKLRSDLEEFDSKMTALADARKTKQSELEEAAVLKWLLFETGKPLERAILKALILLGFSAEPFKNAESEFDAIFVSPEGRCLGEAEGKDNKAVNVGKDHSAISKS